MSTNEVARTLAAPWRRRIETLRNRHFLLLDAATLCLTPLLALFLRLEELSKIPDHISDLMRYTVAALFARILIFYIFGLYNRYWRFATVDELIQIVTGNIVATIATTALYYESMAFGLIAPSNPRSLPLIDGILTLIVVGGFRLSARLAHRALREPPREDAARVLVVGAGMAGQMLVRELQSKPESRLRPVGFVDDDPEKRNVRILNIPVLGGRIQLATILTAHHIQEVIIAMPDAPGMVVREIMHACERAGIAARTMPSVSAIAEGKVKVSQLRTVQIEDLLRREPIQTDTQSVQNSIRGKRVLVTGGGGSIGSELCRQILLFEPSELVLLGHGENSVFEIQNELHTMRAKLGLGVCTEPTNIRSVIADIRFAGRIRALIEEIRPNVIFHAAAHKHVPLMELNPFEAITNNVLGTRNMLRAARSSGVERFVLISTDKAVNPTNVMGASKRVAELLVLQMARETGLNYVAVRFGNVLGSRGSVVPTFKRQIAQGGPVTVSHPEMRRFFMTIPEAVQLVLQASVLGNGGEIFMLDMGDPVKIVDLARDLIELSGLEIDKDMEIRFTGMRPGEKLFEELFVEGEEYRPTHHPKILIAANAGAFVPDKLNEAIANIEGLLDSSENHAVIEWLQYLVPEYSPDPRRWPSLSAPESHVLLTDSRSPQSLHREEAHAVAERQ